MFCERCGKQINDNSKFCMGCGAPVRGAVQQPGQGAPAPGQTGAGMPGGQMQRAYPAAGGAAGGSPSVTKDGALGLSWAQWVSYGVLALNVIFMIVTLVNCTEDRIYDFMTRPIARTFFFISLILSVGALVYVIIARKKQQPARLSIAIINLILAGCMLFVPALFFAAYW